MFALRKIAQGFQNFVIIYTLLEPYTHHFVQKMKLTSWKGRKLYLWGPKTYFCKNIVQSCGNPKYNSLDFSRSKCFVIKIISISIKSPVRLSHAFCQVMICLGKRYTELTSWNSKLMAITVECVSSVLTRTLPDFSLYFLFHCFHSSKILSLFIACALLLCYDCVLQRSMQ